MRDPVGDGRGDSAVVSPTDDKVVVVVGGGVAHGNILGAERWMMILAYLGQTPEVPRTDLRAKHHS
jgi:hypothetical protein